jgi:RimJ/RimL family protein N-acetyltransferase
LRIVWGREDIVAPWIAEEIGVGAIGECRTASVLAADGHLMAAVAFHNWNPDAGVVEVSAASVDPRWASRDVLEELFGYAFAIAQAVVARTAEDNTRVRRLWKAFGATEYIIPRLRGRTASEALLMLTDDAWAVSKMRRQENGQRLRSQAA